MISASKEFKEKLKKGANVVNYADFTLSDGTVLHLEPKDFMIGGCSITDKTTDGKFGVGFTIGKTVTLRIANHDEQFSKYDFYGSTIYLYVALAMDNGTVEKIRKGVYYTTVPETPGDIIEISAVDGMFKLDRDYAESYTLYPATLQKIVTDACLDCGIPIGLMQFDNMYFAVQKKPENVTYRQVVSYAAQIAGYNARIDNSGYMQLVWYDTELLDRYAYNGGDFKNYPHDTIIYGGDFKNYSSDMVISGGDFSDNSPEHIFRVKSLNIHTDDVQITGVRVAGDEKNTFTFGEEGYMIEVKDNPFASEKEQEVANYLGARITGIVFRPFKAEILDNPLHEPFDVVRVSNAKGDTYISLLNSISYKIGEYTSVSCEAEDPVRNGSTYVSAAAQAVVEARRNTEKQITEYDKAVQNMNQLVANSMGLYSEKEMQSDASTISYESNKPISVDENGKCHFEPGSTVWMKSDNGFFISNRGGEPGTFESGWDKNGNVTTNILYAIGIVADWIRSGRLECKKGQKTTFMADVDTGEVRIIADSFSLASGETIESIAKKEAEREAQEAVDSQTRADVLNKLTNNGADNGIYLQGGKLYISFSAARGGELTLGGSNNINGKMTILSSSGKTIGTMGMNGVNFTEGVFSTAGIVNPGTTSEYAARQEVSGSSIKFFYNNIKRSELSTLGKFLNTTWVGHYDSETLAIASDYGVALLSSTKKQSTTGDLAMVINKSNGGCVELFGKMIVRNSIEWPSGQGFSGASLSSSSTSGNLELSGNLGISGNFNAKGTKSRVSDTEKYGKRLLYCYEMPSPMFGDIGEGKTDENGVCYVDIGDIFSETIAISTEYQVFLQKESEGDVWVETKNPAFFVVKGDPNMRFAWEVKAKQKGFEFERLETYDEIKDDVNEINYEDEYMNELNQLINKQEEILYETT